MTSSENGGEGNFKLIERMESGKNLKKVEGTEDVLGRHGSMIRTEERDALGSQLYRSRKKN